MKPVHVRVLKTIAFTPAWVAFIFLGLGYITTGKWMGTLWGEALMLLIAVATALVIYWGLSVEDRKIGKSPN